MLFLYNSAVSFHFFTFQTVPDNPFSWTPDKQNLLMETKSSGDIHTSSNLPYNSSISAKPKKPKKPKLLMDTKSAAECTTSSTLSASSSKECLLMETRSCAESYASTIFVTLPVILKCVGCIELFTADFLADIFDVCEKILRDKIYTDESGVQYLSVDKEQIECMAFHACSVGQLKCSKSSMKCVDFEQSLRTTLKLYIKKRMQYYLNKVNSKKSIRNKLTRTIIHKHM